LPAKPSKFPGAHHPDEADQRRRKPGPKRVSFVKCENCGDDAGRKNTRYCSNVCQAAHRWKQTIVGIESAGRIDTGGGAPVVTARRYLRGRFGCVCRSCGLSEWQGQPIPLVLDHIDGNADNWRLDNLRLICPNCDALTPTFKNRNRGKGRYSRRARYAAGKSY
jgi:hypothetical protein